MVGVDEGSSTGHAEGGGTAGTAGSILHDSDVGHDGTSSAQSAHLQQRRCGLYPRERVMCKLLRMRFALSRIPSMVSCLHII